MLIGVALGLVLRGDPRRVAELNFRWMPIVFIGFAFQLVLFSDVVTERVGDLGPPLYVGSTVVVLAAILRNWRIPGLPIVALGSVSNIAAILANGGFMPASAEAMAALGKSAPVVYSNSALLAHPALEPLTDIFALPRWLPFANVFSIGDVLIAVGVVCAIVMTMRSPKGLVTNTPDHTGVAPEHLSLVTDSTGTYRSFAEASPASTFPAEGQNSSSIGTPSRANPS